VQVSRLPVLLLIFTFRATYISSRSSKYMYENYYFLLFFQEILKYSEKAGEDTKDLHRALEVMCVVPKAANDMMNVGRLQGFNVRVDTITNGFYYHSNGSNNSFLLSLICHFLFCHHFIMYLVSFF